MSSSSREPVLAEECRVFTRYLTGQPPTDYVVRKYQQGHQAIPYRLKGEEDAFDVFLAIAARRGPFMARIADAYARRARPHGVLRQKLSLLLAILENSPSDHRRFTAGGRGILLAWLVTGYCLARFVFFTLVGTLFFGPLKLLLKGRKPARQVPA